MNTNNLKHIGSLGKEYIKKNSPKIMTGMAIIGLGVSIYTAIKSTPEAMAILEEEKIDRAKQSEDGEIEPITPVDTVKLCWKCYIPTIISCGSTILFIISSDKIYNSRNIALASAYNLSSKMYKEYKDSVKEVVNEETQVQINESFAKKKITNDPIKETEDVPGIGELCYDDISGRYFRCSVDEIKKIEVELNKSLINDTFISINEYYSYVGLKNISIGEDLGWDLGYGYVEFGIDTILTDDNKPCIVVSPNVVYRNNY